MDEGGCVNKVAFCFPGQGSFEAGMGRDVAEAIPAAKEVFERGSAACGIDLERLCFEAPLEELLDTAVQQPALVATSLALLAAVRERGLEPDYVVGHSVGEFAALAAAGAMTTEEAIALVRERDRAVQAATGEPQVARNRAVSERQIARHRGGDAVRCRSQDLRRGRGGLYRSRQACQFALPGWHDGGRG